MHMINACVSSFDKCKDNLYENIERCFSPRKVLLGPFALNFFFISTLGKHWSDFIRKHYLLLLLKPCRPGGMQDVGFVSSIKAE